MAAVALGEPAATTGYIGVLKVQGNVYMPSTPADVAVQVGDDGIVVVNTAVARALVPAIAAALKKINDSDSELLYTNVCRIIHHGMLCCCSHWTSPGRQPRIVAGGQCVNLLGGRSAAIQKRPAAAERRIQHSDEDFAFNGEAVGRHGRCRTRSLMATASSISAPNVCGW